MKKITILFLLISCSAIAQKRETTTNFDWKNNSWQISNTIIRVSDGNGNITEQIIKNASGNFQSRNSIVYNAQNQVIQTLFQTYHGGWLDQNKSSSRYDSRGNLIETISYRRDHISNQWDITAGERNNKIYANNFLIEESQEEYDYASRSWKNTFKYIFLNDSSGNQIEIISQEWQSNAWQNKSKSIRKFNSNNDVIENFSQDWNGTSWENDTKYLSTFNQNNELIESITQNWDKGLQRWVNFRRFYQYAWHNYSKNLLDSLTHQLWRNNAWENFEHRKEFFNSNDQSTYVLNRRWINQQWENNYKYKYIYDSFQNRIQSLNSIWQNNTWVCNSGIKYTNTYDLNQELLEQIVERCDRNNPQFYNSHKRVYSRWATNIQEIEQQKIKIYPNPAFSQIFVELPEISSNAAFYRIFDINGKIILQENILNQNQLEINLDGLPEGIYQIKVIGDKIYTSSFLKMK